MPIEDWNKYLDNINVPTDSVPSHSGSSHSEQEDFFSCLSVETDKFTKEQKCVIVDMLGTRSGDYKNSSTKSEIWNSIILQMPVCTKRTIYRYLNEYDNADPHVGETLSFDYSLTATRRGHRFDGTSDKKGTIKYVIKCKPPKSTRAHMVDGLWNPNCKALKDEQQVNFENGTSFYVDRIHFAHRIKYIYMHEI